MPIRVAQEAADDAGNLEAYASVPIAFAVRSRLAVRPVEHGLGGLLLVEEPVTPSYIKDYDSEDGEAPVRWGRSFDLSNWRLFSAFEGDRRVGGAAVAWKTPGVDMLEGRDDLAVLWDLRVDPDFRGRSIGHRLFEAASEWARQHGCRELKIETQNTNVAACRFYARQECELTTIRSDAYRDLPHEVQLLWYKQL